MQINNAGVGGWIMDPEKLAKVVEQEQKFVSILAITPFISISFQVNLVLL